MSLTKMQLEQFCNAGSDPNLGRNLGIGVTNAPTTTYTPG
jgi:hypothetical protein